MRFFSPTRLIWRGRWLGALAIATLAACSDLQVPGLGEEQIPADEAAAIESVISMFRVAVAERDVSGPTLRGAHPKHHGCAVAEFAVNDTIAAEHRTTLFSPGARYPAVVRFSNNADPQPDQEADVRGMAIKLFNVDGTRLFQPQPDVSTYDLLLVSHPVFLFPDVATYAQAFEAFANDEAVEFFFNPLDSHLRAFLIVRKMLAKHTDLTAIRWFSMVPYAFGPSRAVKYSAWPCATKRSSPALADAPNFLATRLAETLSHSAVCFEFGVQFQTDPKRMPIENPSKEWSEVESPFIPLGQLVLPAQDLTASTAANSCENLSFNPWRALPEHRPLGGISRARLKIYEAMSNYRRERNKLPTSEPIGPLGQAAAELRQNHAPH